MLHCQIDVIQAVPPCAEAATHAAHVMEPRGVDEAEGVRERHVVLCTEHARQVAWWVDRLETLPREAA